MNYLYPQLFQLPFYALSVLNTLLSFIMPNYNITMRILIILFACLISITLPANITNKRIVTLIATNDIHGYVLPKSFVRTDNHQTYTQGGLSVLATLIQIARQENPGNTLYFDSGDQFQGGLESSPLITSGSLLNAYTEYLHLDGAAIGNHQFDFGSSFLQNFLTKRKTATLAANIIKNQESNALPKQQKSHLYTLQNGIKIGAIGLTTILTPQRSPGWTLKDQNIDILRFKQYKQIVQQQSSILKSLGANAVILVTHVGQNCFIDSPKYGIWTKANTAQSCDSNGQIHKLLTSLKTGTIDAVLQGHYHVIAHNYIEGIPVVGNNMGGKYFNILYLQFQQEKIVNTFIQGPIPVCQKVFAKTMHCEYVETLEQTQAAGDLVNWKFHGSIVQLDRKLQQIFDHQLKDKLKPYFQVLCQNQLLLKPSYDEETELNNLLARAVHSTIPADFTLLAPSLLRQTLYPGPIKKIDIYNFHPFNSPFVLIRLSGADFISALAFLQQNSDSYHFSNELKQVVSLSENREKKGLLSVSWYNRSQIQPEKEITGIVHNFTLSFIINKYNITKLKTFGTVRQIFENYLKGLGRITKKLGLMDDKNPHLIVKTVPNT